MRRYYSLSPFTRQIPLLTRLSRVYIHRAYAFADCVRAYPKPWTPTRPGPARPTSLDRQGSEDLLCRPRVPWSGPRPTARPTRARSLFRLCSRLEPFLVTRCAGSYFNPSRGTLRLSVCLSGWGGGQLLLRRVSFSPGSSSGLAISIGPPPGLPPAGLVRIRSSSGALVCAACVVAMVGSS